MLATLVPPISVAVPNLKVNLFLHAVDKAKESEMGWMNSLQTEEKEKVANRNISV
jgi:hypothetical protein